MDLIHLVTVLATDAMHVSRKCGQLWCQCEAGAKPGVEEFVIESVGRDS